MSRRTGLPGRDVVRRLARAGCVYAEEEAALLGEAASSAEHLDRLVDRRAAGVPLEQVVGWAALGGVRVRLSPGVFVPRRRTELLVRAAAELLSARPGALVVELCCGSGAVSVALLHRSPALDLHAVDLDPAAASCAADNLGGAATVHVGDLFAPLPALLRERADLVLASPPYVPTDAVALLPREAREHEPLLALDGGPDGTDVALRIVAEAPGWLRPGGTLLLETAEGQGPRVADACRRRGMGADVLRCEELGSTVVAAVRR